MILISVSSSFENFINSDFSFDFVTFLLLFSIFLFALNATNVFGKEKKSLNYVLAFVLSLMAVIPSILGLYPAGIDILRILQDFLPNLAVMILIIILLMMLSGLLGLENEFFAKKKHTIFSLVFLITINVVMYYTKPDLFDFFLTFSVLSAIFSYMAKEQGITTYLPITFVVVFFYLFGDAFFSAFGGVPWLNFFKDPLIQNSVIGILIFMIIIRFVFRD